MSTDERPASGKGPVIVNMVTWANEAPGIPGIPPVLPPMAMVTRPQDWHETARHILWPHLARQAQRG